MASHMWSWSGDLCNNHIWQEMQKNNKEVYISFMSQAKLMKYKQNYWFFSVFPIKVNAALLKQPILCLFVCLRAVML